MLQDSKGNDTVKATRIVWSVFASEFWTYMSDTQQLLSTQKAEKDILDEEQDLTAWQ